MKLSILTCTRNPRPEVFARVLAALDRQTLPKKHWEHLVIDNASNPSVASLDLLKHYPSARLLREDREGKAWAEIQGIEASSGEFVAIVDDDNILAADYLANAVEQMERHPFLGILGGVGAGEFEGPIEPWMEDFLPQLGVNQDCSAEVDGLQYGMIRKIGPWLPIGAGMVMRRALAVEYRERLRKDSSHGQICRTGDRSVLGGSDTDITFIAIGLSWACGVSSRLKYTHVIPEWRLEPRYLERLLYASNYGVATLLVHHGWKKPATPWHEPVWQRVRRRLASARPSTPERRCWKAFRKGYQDGLARKPYDERYR